MVQRGTNSPGVVLREVQQKSLNFLLRPTEQASASPIGLCIERTGGGKTAIFFIASKLLRNRDPKFGPTIVISPLLAIVNDQLEAAQRYGVKAVAYNSTLSDLKKGEVKRQVNANEIDLLFLTPEMVMSSQLASHFPHLAETYKPKPAHKWTQPSFIVFDEAHCISTMGHDFRRNYLDCLPRLGKCGFWR